MVLLDQERQEAKAARSTLTTDLEKAAQKVQSQRETVVALEASIEELTSNNEKLESELATQSAHNAVLQVSIEEQKAATAAVEHEFSFYKQRHALGGELGALQDAVARLQAQ
jgi:FtsZ-binding cell division protein ZapB|tara:strand:+ start:341 stop:676 length:336 start_codon:yes stop_codon:yes gene_type:complete